MPEPAKNNCCYSRKEFAEGRHKLIVLSTGKHLIFILHLDGHLDWKTGIVEPDEVENALEELMRRRQVPENTRSFFRSKVLNKEDRAAAAV